MDTKAIKKCVRWGARCRGCPFARKGKPSNPVLAQFPSRGSYVLVGESPGLEEVREGVPFKGATGRQLDEELRMVGLNRRDAFVINAIACKPLVKTDGNMRKAVKACRKVFRRQLQQFMRQAPKAKHAFVMGKWAALAFTGKASVGGRGFIQTWNRFKREWLGVQSWHPTYAFYYNPYEWGTFSIDLDRFSRLMMNQIRSYRELCINTDFPALLAFLNDATREKLPISVDIETGPARGDPPDPKKPGHTLRRTALNPLTATLKTISLGTVDRGHALYWPKAGVKTRMLIKKVLEDPKIVKVVHNGHWFDLRVLERYGMRMA